jgi:hypothetical protein
MSNIPPRITDKPPVITSPPRYPRNKSWVLWPKLVLFLAIAYVGFLAFRAAQFGMYLKNNPQAKAPGETEFREANRQIIANHGTVAFGNSSEAIVLAEQYAENLKSLRSELFSKGKEGSYSIAKGEFLTYCQQSKDACVFLVHVPELRRFTPEAKESLGELAWLNAQMILAAATSRPPQTVVVGVKGAILYDTVLIGDFVSDLSSKSTGIKTRGAGIEGMQLLYPFFAPIEGANEIKEDAASPQSRTKATTSTAEP